ncbi:hypothetical protein ABZ260_39615 [Streptosporangium sp. NPDC006013]|uniref:hypothetical protein n=1 Tax=Streptosporangium sp. NPDC006013 TaxID=3155596 RepID=UPI0033B0366C
MTVRRQFALAPAVASKPDVGDVGGLQEPARRIACGQAWTPGAGPCGHGAVRPAGRRPERRAQAGRFDPVTDAPAADTPADTSAEVATATVDEQEGGRR